MSTRTKIVLGISIVVVSAIVGWPILIDYLIPVSPYW